MAAGARIAILVALLVGTSAGPAVAGAEEVSGDPGATAATSAGRDDATAAAATSADAGGAPGAPAATGAATMGAIGARTPDVVLEPIVVTATRLPAPLADVPAAVSVVGRDEIHDGRPTVALDETLNRVPGVFVQNDRNFAQDLRVQIRGFGTRSAFGVREVKVLVDGLPETLPDGQTELDALDVGAVDRVEVVRGPTSSLYGNASGGVIQVFTAEPPGTPHASIRLTGGSYGLGKYDLEAGGRAGNAGVALHAAFVQLDGYREHAAAERGTLTAKLRYAIGEDTDVMVLLSGLDTLGAEDAGGLAGAEVRDDRRQARALNRELDAGEAVTQGRIGTVLSRHAESSDLSAHAYVLYRGFAGRLPILPEAGDGITAFSRVSPGAGIRYGRTLSVGGRESTLLAGVDVQDQADDRRRFANVGGRRGALGLAQDERVTSVGPYLRWTLLVRDDLEASAGVRYDRVRFDVDVRTPRASGDSGTRTLAAWSPAGGIVWRPRRWLSLFTDIGTAFQTPTTTELANPEGAGFNARLQPQHATSVEVGARAALRELGTASVTGFYLDLEDTLIGFESLSGRTFFRNAGRSERYGVEADWQLDLTPELRWSMALTFLHARFRRYRTDAGDFAGNDEPGIPGGLLHGELLYRSAAGLYAALEAQLVDGFYVDDANTTRAPGYELFDVRGGWERAIGRVHVEPFVGIQNLTGATYDGVVRLNAAGGRFFEPVPRLNVYGGVGIRVEI